jgi:hypothetical protein
MNFEPAKTIDQLYFSNMIWWYWVCPQFYFVLIHLINEKVDGWFGVHQAKRFWNNPHQIPQLFSHDIGENLVNTLAASILD